MCTQNTNSVGENGNIDKLEKKRMKAERYVKRVERKKGRKKKGGEGNLLKTFNCITFAQSSFSGNACTA